MAFGGNSSKSENRLLSVDLWLQCTSLFASDILSTNLLFLIHYKYNSKAISESIILLMFVLAAHQGSIRQLQSTSR